MRLTYFTDFGLRALMRMASDPEQGFTTAELAEEFGISRHHLTKIIQKLSQAGIVTTRRGSGGGVLLARDPAEIRIGAIVRLLEHGQFLVDCFSPGCNCGLVNVCRLKSRLRAAEAAFLAELDRCTLADIALPPALPAGMQFLNDYRIPG